MGPHAEFWLLCLVCDQKLTSHHTTTTILKRKSFTRDFPSSFLCTLHYFGKLLASNLASATWLLRLSSKPSRMRIATCMYVCAASIDRNKNCKNHFDKTEIVVARAAPLFGTPLPRNEWMNFPFQRNVSFRSHATFEVNLLCGAFMLECHDIPKPNEILSVFSS